MNTAEFIEAQIIPNITTKFLAKIADDAFSNAYDSFDDTMNFSDLMELFTNNINQFISEQLLISAFGFSEEEMEEFFSSSGGVPYAIDDLIDEINCD